MQCYVKNERTGGDGVFESGSVLFCGSDGPSIFATVAGVLCSSWSFPLAQRAKDSFEHVVVVVVAVVVLLLLLLVLLLVLVLVLVLALVLVGVGVLVA